MKKSLLLMAGVAVAFSASAIEVGFMDSEALGLAGKPTLDDMTPLASTENVEMFFYFGQETSAQNPDFNGFKQVIVNGEAIDIVQGIGGVTNGVCNLDDGPSTGGCMYLFKVKKDGYLIVPSKISSNKNFYVYEGLVGEAPQPVAYTLGMDLQSGDYPDVPSINYTLPADELGYVNREAADIDKYTFGGNTIAWPIRIQTGNAEAASGGSGTGALVFKVFAEAENYFCFATGSKMNTCGFIFVEGNTLPNVSVYAPERTPEEGDVIPAKTVVITGSATGGIDNIATDVKVAELDWNAPVYNVMGQKVSKNFKGIAIQNGAKFVVK